MPSVIDNLYTGTSRLLTQLTAAGDLSMHSFANENLRKVLLLSAASWFETRISAAVERFANIQSNGHSGIEALVKRWAVDGMYHRYFEWRKQKPGPFYSLFGEQCGAILKSEIIGSQELKKALDDFLELGNLRNELVHENFAAYPFEKTAEEVYELFQSAEKFVVFVEGKLADAAFGRPSVGNTAIPEDFAV